MVKVFAQLIGGVRVEFEADGTPLVSALQEAVAAAVGRPPTTFKMVHKGKTLDSPEAVITLSEADSLLVVPIRKAPPPGMVRAAIAARSGRVGMGEEDEEEEEDEPAHLPPGAGKWEHKIVEALRKRGAAPWVVEWLIILRPQRLVLFVAFLFGCSLASRLGVGPVFILVAMIVAIFRNLGRKREGEASAYSICNPGVQRLPGQLDADQIDRQIRNGQF